MNMPAQHTVRRLLHTRRALETLLAVGAAVLLVYIASKQAQEAAHGKQIQPVRQAMTHMERLRQSNNEHNSLQAILADENQAWESLNSWLTEHAPHSGHCTLGRHANPDGNPDADTPLHAFKLACEGYGKQTASPAFEPLQNLQVFDTKQQEASAGKQGRRPPKNKSEGQKATDTDHLAKPVTPAPEGWLKGPQHHHVFNHEMQRWEVK